MSLPMMSFFCVLITYNYRINATNIKVNSTLRIAEEPYKI
jgi:hypothetical protein